MLIHCAQDNLGEGSYLPPSLVVVADGSDLADMAMIWVSNGIYVVISLGVFFYFAQSVDLSRSQLLVIFILITDYIWVFIIIYYCLIQAQFINSDVLQNHVLQKAQS